MPRKKSHRLKSTTATGIIRMHPRGFGFVVPDEKESFPEDIFIPPRFTKGAVDSDRVEVSINTYVVSEKGPEGRVTKILERGRSHVAGTITYIGKKQIYALVPLLSGEPLMRIRPSNEQALEVGDRIIIHVLNWGSKTKESLGEMSAHIGHILDPSCDLAAAIEEFELSDTFSKKVLKEAKAFGQTVSAQEISEREDFRSLNCITIDPDTAKDFDDAISLTEDKKGCFHLGVHIADVSHYVKPGSSLDKEARLRSNSVYFPDHVLPMLPHELSSHLCSLKPNVNRLAVSVLMILDKKGNVTHYRMAKSVIRSKKRFSYKEAKEVLDGKKKSKFLTQLRLMEKLCYLLKQRRYERGCVEFALPDLSMQLTKEGAVKKVELVEYDITHQMIEEFMLLANEMVATHLSKENKPLTYRIHEEPNPENISNFAFIANAIGFTISDNPTAEELQKLFDEARQSPFGQFLATAFIKSMKLASYSTQNIGHYGLGLEYYTHFTSPIRRYIDLIVHRVLFDEVDPKQDLEKIALACSEKERLSAKAESSVLYLKKLRYLLTLKENGQDIFNGVVVSIKPFGVIFELKELLFEGVLTGREHYFEIGDKIQVKLTDIDLVSRQTEWTLKSSFSKNKKRKKRR